MLEIHLLTKIYFKIFIIDMECNVYKEVNGVDEKKIKEVVFGTLKKLNRGRGEVSVHVVSKKKIKSLNKKYRKKNRVTDVLSFGTEDLQNKTEQDLGDIFICLEQIKKQAKENKIVWQEELGRMIVHGVMHLLGYDHQNSKDSKAMFRKQEKFVNELL